MPVRPVRMGAKRPVHEKADLAIKVLDTPEQRRIGAKECKHVPLLQPGRLTCIRHRQRGRGQIIVREDDVARGCAGVIRDIVMLREEMGEELRVVDR